LGVTLTQLLRLDHQLNPTETAGYYFVGRPLGALFQIGAISLALVGAHRFWRQQMSMARGKVRAGGWEIYAIMISFFLVRELIMYKPKSRKTYTTVAYCGKLLPLACSGRTNVI